MSLFQEFTTAESVTAVFLGLLGRPPQQAGLDHYVAAIDDPNNGYGISEMLSELVNSQPEWQEKTENLTRAQLVDYLFNNLFDRDPTYDETGSNYWVDGEGAAVPADQMVTALIEGAQAQDQVALANKVDATMDPETGFTLTNKADVLNGSDLDDVFQGPLVQNDLGGVTNSLASDDQIHGGAGTDALYANLVPETTMVGAPSDVIKPVTTSVENAFFTMQTGYNALEDENFLDDIFDFVGDLIDEYGGEDECRYDTDYDMAVEMKQAADIHIDAQDMNGIEQLWSLDSRADLYIEDVRSRPQDVTIGMSGTDPQVSYFVDFDSDVIAGDFGNSAVSFEFANLLSPEDELLIGEEDGGWVGSLEFTLNGETYVINGGDVSDATTFAELEAAVEASLAAQGLTGLEVSLDTSFLNPVNNQPGAMLTIFDPDGGIFTNPKTNVSDGAQSGALYFDAQVGAPEVLDVETNIVLDNVGRNDQGGILDIGGMSNQGIQIFNVEVDAKSWLAGLSSTSRIVNPYTDSHHHLEVVNVSHVAGGDMGDLVIGTQMDPMDTDVNPTSLPTGARVNPNGLINVREFNAAGFQGALNIGATLNDYSIFRYLDTSGGEEVDFNYIMGDGDSLLTLALSNDLSVDPLFNLSYLGGAGDDRLNLVDVCYDGFSLASVSIDGGLGYNTLEVQDDIGTSPLSTPAFFANIDKLVLAGWNDSDANMANLPGVTELVIASEDYNSHTITNLDASETSVTISGKNQTKGTGNADDNQDFNEIEIDTVGNENLLINIENTARSTGELYIDGLTITDTPTVTLDVDVSENDRVLSQSVYIDDLEASDTSTLIVQGTLDTTIRDVDDFGAAGSKALISAEDLEGSFWLGVDADWVTQHDADAGSEFIGTAGANDTLQFYNGVLNTTNDTQVSGFETIEFEDIEGVFDASGVSGEQVWNIVSTNDYFQLINLSGNVTINVDVNDVNGDAPTLGGGGDEFLVEGGASGTLTLNLRDVDNTGDRVLVQNFQSIVLNFAADNSTAAETFYVTHVDPDGDYFLNDGLDGDFTDPSTSGYDPEAVTTRNITVTGGDAGDSLNLGILSNVLNTVDLSGYMGSVSYNLGIYDEADLDRNTTIKVGTFGLDHNETELGNDGHITTFQFTSDAAAFGVVWEISDFDAFDAAGTDLTNLSILDTSALGVNGFADLNVEDAAAYWGGLSIAQQNAYTANGYVAGDFAAGDVVITSEQGLNFTILLNQGGDGTLTGVSDLTEENFGNFVI